MPQYTMPRQIKLGLSMRYLGYHAGAWRHPDTDPNGASKLSHFVRVAQTAEAAKMDMVFLADGIGIRTKDEPPGALCRSAQTAELEPLTLLSALLYAGHILVMGRVSEPGSALGLSFVQLVVITAVCTLAAVWPGPTTGMPTTCRDSSTPRSSVP